MPEVTTDNKKISLRMSTFAGIIFFAISLTFSATKFWSKAEATAKEVQNEKQAEKRRLQHLVEKQDYKVKIMFLELKLDECLQK